jgi:hypothetical protein
MADDKPFKRPDHFAKVGDKDAHALHLAVGEALGIWENTERGFASIFAKLVAPRGSGFAAKRAYGTIIASAVRRQVIEAAAKIFFRNFPDAEAEIELPILMELYSNATGRRNDFAHGIVGGDFEDGKFWHFLVPNTWGSKSRDMNLELDYRYSSSQINDYAAKFIQLGGRAYHFFERLDAVYRAAPETARAPY